MPRLRRVTFILTLVVLSVISAISFYAASGDTVSSDDPFSQYYPAAGALALVAATILSFVMSIARLHDMDKSGWWSLFTLMPIANLILLIGLCIWPGTHGANRFGRDPRRRRAPAAVAASDSYALSSGDVSDLDALKRLGALRREGVLTQSEFDLEKAERLQPSRPD